MKRHKDPAQPVISPKNGPSSNGRLFPSRPLAQALHYERETQ